jgi:hypothetical protein
MAELPSGTVTFLFNFRRRTGRGSARPRCAGRSRKSTGSARGARGGAQRASRRGLLARNSRSLRSPPRARDRTRITSPSRPGRARRQPCARARYFRNAGALWLANGSVAAIAERFCEPDSAAVVGRAADVVRYSARNPSRESAAACGTDLGPMRALDRAGRRQGILGRVGHVPDSARSPRHITGRVLRGTGPAAKIAHKQAKCPQGVPRTGHGGICVRERDVNQLDRVASVHQAFSNVSDRARVAASTATHH